MLSARLAGYQREGVRWMLEKLSGPSGACVLADEPGLGKTVQAIATIAALADCDLARRILVLAPANVVGVWEAEFEKFADAVRVVADAWLREHEDDIDEAARKRSRRTGSVRPADELRQDDGDAPEEAARAFLLGALRGDAARGNFALRANDLEPFVDLLVEPHLFTYRHTREVLGADGVGPAFYDAAQRAHAARGAATTVGGDTIRTAETVLGWPRDGSLVERLRKGERPSET